MAHTVARPVENRAGLSASRFTRSHFNRIARTSEEKKKEREAREKTGRFFRPNPGPASITLTRTGSTEALGGGSRPLNYRAELFLLSIYRSLPRAYVYETQGWPPRTDVTLARKLEKCRKIVRNCKYIRYIVCGIY